MNDLDPILNDTIRYLEQLKESGIERVEVSRETLEELAAVAGGDFVVTRAAADKVELALDASAGKSSETALRVGKVFVFSRTPKKFSVACDVNLAWKGPRTEMQAGIEVVVNLLASH